MINGQAHGPWARTTTCQLHMREYEDGAILQIEPWRSEAFPVVQDLIVDRGAFDRIVQAGGYVSIGTGSAPEANLIPVEKDVADDAFDAATCIGCGACVAQCPNGAAQLFTSAKVGHLNILPQGQHERDQRAVDDGRADGGRALRQLLQFSRVRSRLPEEHQHRLDRSHEPRLPAGEAEGCEEELRRFLLVACLSLGLSPAGAIAQSDDRRFTLQLEGGPLWQSRNDVRIPNETGTKFSLVDAVGSGPYSAFRVEAFVEINEKNGLRFVAAPLVIEDDATLGETVLFAGGSFAPGVPTEATYKFSSYRATYRYRVYEGDTWRWKLGFTAFIRDARIALAQEGVDAEDTDVGFVPLVHLNGRARLSEKLSFFVDFDGLGSTQGRAFDVAAKLDWSLSDRVGLAFGYRTIEGGADVERVYNFAWLHFAVASVRVGF